jgi:hypothetical protein
VVVLLARLRHRWALMDGLCLVMFGHLQEPFLLRSLCPALTESAQVVELVALGLTDGFSALFLDEVYP